MGRRVSLPGAAELFRSTAEPRASRTSEAASAVAGVRVTAALRSQEAGDGTALLPAQANAVRSAPDDETPPAADPAGGSAPLAVAARAALDGSSALDGSAALAGSAGAGFAGDALHELLSVRLPSQLVLDLERARRLLAREHGLPMGRSELLAAAVSVALTDFEARGARSALVARVEERVASD